MNPTKSYISQLQCRIAWQRDTKAYELLYKQLHKPLICFAETMLKSKEAAEEVYSDVMLKLWNMGERISDIDDVQVYLYRSVKNASLNYIDKYYKLKTVDISRLEFDTPATDDVFHHVAATELNQRIALTVRSLPEKCQLVYRLIKENGFSYKQTAEIMNISVNTVVGHMTLALKKISQSLKPYLHSNR